MEKEHILVVDDEEGLLHLVKMRLTAMGFAVTGCTTGREAIAAAKKDGSTSPLPTSAWVPKTD